MASVAPLLLSLMTSGVVLLAAFKLSDTVYNTTSTVFAFLALVPALVSIGVVSEGLGWGIFTQLWIASRHTPEQTMTPANASEAARMELLKALSDRWWQHGRTSLGRSFGLNIQRPEFVTRGSSLYEQVQGHLQDHLFSRSTAETPVYLMDSTTGYFLRATQRRKLVLTSKPNASCLFYVERGKTHHWGFRAVATQRYMGQNIVQKLVATSKKLHAWEAFRVLQRPGDKGVGACSPLVYMILCSARFGKGMWLANRPAFAPSVPTSRSSNVNFDEDESLFSDHDHTSQKSSRKHGIFLSKQLNHAIGLMYSSDLSALMTHAGQVRTPLGLRALARAQTSPHLNGRSRQTNSGMLRSTMFTMLENGDEDDADTDLSGRATSFLLVNGDDSMEPLKPLRATVSD
ncbi:Actin cross-linking [Plasmopara halstedii]|uniref:Actin cross-linking n=1 Tax=Plasmopara halstedii TaxID=4781 RepID=A0A0P1AHN0_PLAHL|nr:Actin cross-linking [Plasmopara halstedii]CEG40268.1 Actin cross-linking [Plasmopara halstedii]|eukprot:XP_024576637.1 Actin cross-linking [Plasmopara halstedii]